MATVIVDGVVTVEDVTTPHLAYPFRMTPGGAVLVEQDSIDEIAGCVAAICDTPQGSRDDQPSFGIPDPLFGPVPLRTQPIVAAITVLEPRAKLTVTDSPDRAGVGARDLTILVGSVL
jgi:phage baseplate assembly protein W